MKVILKHIIIFLLTIEARIVLMIHRPKIIAVTGSVGKTSAKDSIFAVLSTSFHVRKSDKSFNSEFGVPLTILGLPNAWSSPIGWLENIAEGFHRIVSRAPYPEWLVLEVGADKPGDIASLKWLKPHMVVFTRFPDVPVHVEAFESPEQVTQEKLELFNALREDGTLIINADDPNMTSLAVSEEQHKLSFGFATEATVRGENEAVVYENGRPVGVSVRLTFQHSTYDVVLQGTLGKHNMYALLAAATVGVSEGMAFSHVVEALGQYAPPPGRMRILSGTRGAILIDDTYNSSPIAVSAGLATLGALHVSGKKYVVLGDMMELGDFSVVEHKKVGVEVAKVADVFFAVGIRMRNAADEVRKKHGTCKRVESFQDAREALAALEPLLVEGDVVYIKGSQSMRMERVVAGILENPSQASELLVRQDSEWKKR